MTDTNTAAATNLLSLADTGEELLEALEYIALDEMQEWQSEIIKS